MADAVQPDVRGRLLGLRRASLHRGWHDRGSRVLHPRVVDDVLEGGAVGRPQRQTPLDQLLAFWAREGNQLVPKHNRERKRCTQSELTGRDPPPEKNLRPHDLVVVLKRDVATHHVVQQDAQGPHRRRATVIAVISDPLRWTVHSGAYKTETRDKNL